MGQTGFSQHERADAPSRRLAGIAQSLAQKFDQTRVNDPIAALPPTNQCVEIRIVRRLCRDAGADRASHGAASLGQQTPVIDRLAHLPIENSKTEGAPTLIT